MFGFDTQQNHYFFPNRHGRIGGGGGGAEWVAPLPFYNFFKGIIFRVVLCIVHSPQRTFLCCEYRSR